MTGAAPQSTFTDTNVERNLLMDDVTPYLQEYARQRGFEFVTTEMRWGIRSEASADHQTSEICMQVSHEPLSKLIFMQHKSIFIIHHSSFIICAACRSSTAARERARASTTSSSRGRSASLPHPVLTGHAASFTLY